MCPWNFSSKCQNMSNHQAAEPLEAPSSLTKHARKGLNHVWPFCVHALRYFIWVIWMLPASTSTRSQRSWFRSGDQASATNKTDIETLGSLWCTFPNCPCTCAAHSCTGSKLAGPLCLGCQTPGSAVHASPSLCCPGRPVSRQRCCPAGLVC